MVDETSNLVDTYDSCPPYNSSTGDSTGPIRERRQKGRRQKGGLTHSEDFQSHYSPIPIVEVGKWDISSSPWDISSSPREDRRSHGEFSGC